MSNITICARFRPLSTKEKSDHGDDVCVHALDAESFTFKDEKDEESTFSFDRVFYQGSEQADVYNFLARPIVSGNIAYIFYFIFLCFTLRIWMVELFVLDSRC
jgi:kinesin family protein 5